MDYLELYQQSPMLFFIVIILSLIITVFVYGAFPFIFSKARRTPITKKKYKTLCYGLNIIGIIFFCIIKNEVAAFGPYMLWTWIFSNYGLKQLEKKGLIRSPTNSNLNVEKSSDITYDSSTNTENYDIQTSSLENKKETLALLWNDESIDDTSTNNKKNIKNTKSKIKIITIIALVFVVLITSISIIATILLNDNVEWISERDFFYYEDVDKYVLLFELSNKNDKAIDSNGTVEIQIVNNDSVIVYEKTIYFSENNFEEWSYGDGTERFLASIYIDPNDIISGTTPKGTVYFVVYGDDYYFEKSTLTVFDLPMNFKDLTYSGTGSQVINDIVLPRGQFRVTCTLFNDSYTTMRLYYDTNEELVFNHYEPNTTEITMLYGPINNASIVINGESSYGEPASWKITIESIEN